MKKLLILILIFITISFISCASTQIEADDTIYRLYTDKLIIPVRGYKNEDGSIIEIDPDNPDYYKYDLIEGSFDIAPTYYKLNEQKNKFIILGIESYNDEYSLYSWSSFATSTKVIDFTPPQKYIPTELRGKETIMLIDFRGKMRPQKPNSSGLVGTWINVNNAMEPLRATVSFYEDGTVSFGDQEEDIYKAHHQYEVINQNIIAVTTTIHSSLSGNTQVRHSFYYFDGHSIYDTIFPLVKPHDSHEILKYLNSLKKNPLLQF